MELFVTPTFEINLCATLNTINVEAHKNLAHRCDPFATTSLNVTPSKQPKLDLGRHVVVNTSRCPGFFPEFIAAVAGVAHETHAAGAGAPP